MWWGLGRDKGLGEEEGSGECEFWRVFEKWERCWWIWSKKWKSWNFFNFCGLNFSCHNPIVWLGRFIQIVSSKSWCRGPCTRTNLHQSMPQSIRAGVIWMTEGVVECSDLLKRGEGMCGSNWLFLCDSHCYCDLFTKLSSILSSIYLSQLDRSV